MKINLERDNNKEEIESGDLVAFTTMEGKDKKMYYRLVVFVNGQFTLLDPRNLNNTCGSYCTIDKLVKALKLVLIAKSHELGLVRLIDIEDNNK